MNNQKVRELIDTYKKNFELVNNAEIYKWQITKHFQEHWNLEASDFHAMLAKAFATSANLLSSGQYFPLRMLLQNAKANPEEIRDLFRNLFDEEGDIPSRVDSFRNGFKQINHTNFPGTQPFQDHRAIMVYLSLRYPDIYYLYKFEMFREFAAIVENEFRPTKGRVENISHYLNMCDLLNAEIRADEELLSKHSNRLGTEEYPDPEYHILTQDLIYAATFHFPRLKLEKPIPVVVSRLTETEAPTRVRPETTITLSGKTTNFIELERRKKQIGDLGELLVLKMEKERLLRLGIRKAPIHSSVSEGDGLGYDILSYDDRGKEIFIEVKTTLGARHEPFYLTRNELQRSIQNSDQFILYRLYNFDITNDTAQVYMISGDVSHLCTIPVLFKVYMDDGE